MLLEREQAGVEHEQCSDRIIKALECVLIAAFHLIVDDGCRQVRSARPGAPRGFQEIGRYLQLLACLERNNHRVQFHPHDEIGSLRVGAKIELGVWRHVSSLQCAANDDKRAELAHVGQAGRDRAGDVRQRTCRKDRQGPLMQLDGRYDETERVLAQWTHVGQLLQDATPQRRGRRSRLG